MGVKGLIGSVMGPKGLKGLKTKHLFNPLNPIYLKINYKKKVIMDF